MKKSLLILSVLSVVVSANIVMANTNTVPMPTAPSTSTPSPVIKVDVPAEKNTFKENVQETTDKAVKATKSFSKKTVESTKKAYEKTKEFTSEAVDNTKYTFENLNPNKEVTINELKQDAQINTLKNERKELKSAYNSRIKDTKAKIEITELSTQLSDVQRRNRVYVLQKDLADLEKEKKDILAKYDAKIKTVQNEMKAQAKAKRDAEAKARKAAKAKAKAQAQSK